MASLPFENLLSFRTFLAQSNGSALVFAEDGRLARNIHRPADLGAKVLLSGGSSTS